MKKILSLALALVMILSLSTVAFAAAEQDKANSFTKEYVITNGESPAEDFEFTVAYESYKNNEGIADATMTAEKAPTVTLEKASFAALTATSTDDVTVTIGDVTNAALGVYTYKITETAGDTAGVTYNSDPVYLVVTVLRDENSTNHYVAAIHYETATGEKTGEITNSYDAGNLTVTKQIEGNMADMDKEFAFTITLTAPDNTKFADNQNVVDNADATVTTTSDSVWTITVDLGDDDSINITNIPVGTTYTVSEVEDGYTKAHTVEADGSITGGDTDQDTWTNTLTAEVDTGIVLDSMPYVLILAVVAGAICLTCFKKREA